MNNVPIVLSKKDWTNVLESVKHNRYLYDLILNQLNIKYRKKTAKTISVKKIAEKHKRELILNSTIYENKAYQILESLKIKFSKQKIYYYFQGNREHYFIVDLYIPKYKLVIEIDGSQHLKKENLEKDINRTEILLSLGVEKIVRILNKDVNTQTIKNILEKVKNNTL